VRLTAAAEADFRDIIGWTAGQFGDAQARAYAEAIAMALETLTDGPDVPGVRARDEILRGHLTLHVARRGRTARHFIMFRFEKAEDGGIIEVLRILHDAMDFSPRPPSENPPPSNDRP
jgi:toxin ParE1/3/4